MAALRFPNTLQNGYNCPVELEPQPPIYFSRLRGLIGIGSVYFNPAWRKSQAGFSYFYLRECSKLHCYIIPSASGVRVRAALLVRGATPMDTILQVIRALGALASIARLLLELFGRWDRRKHNAEGEGR